MFIIDYARVQTRKHKILVIFLGVLTLIGGALAYIAGTHKGFKLALSALQPVLSSQGIRYETEGLKGNLFSFTLPSLEIDLGDVDVSIKNIEVDWNPMYVLADQISVNYAKLGTVKVAVLGGPDKKEDDGLEDLKHGSIVPFNLHAGKVAIERTIVTVDHNTVAQVENLQGQVGIVDNTLTFDNISLRAYNGLLTAPEVSGTLSFRPPFKLDTRVHNWSVQHELMVDSRFSSRITGPLLHTFTINTQGEASTTLTPPFGIKATTRINGKRLVNTIHSLALPGQRLAGTMALDYHRPEELVYRLNMHGNTIGVAPMGNTLPYKVRLTATQSAEADGKGTQVTLSDCSLGINQVPLRCQGALQFHNGQMQLDKLYVASQDETHDILKLDGSLLPVPALDWTVNINELGRYYPPAAGKLNSFGNIAGKWLQPSINADLSLTRGGWQGNELPDIHVGATYEDQQQNFRASAADGNAHIDFGAEGHWQQQGWSGKVTHINANWHGTHWRLLGRPALEIGSNRVRIRPVCISYRTSFLCGSFRRDNRGMVVTADSFISHRALSHVLKRYKTTSDFIFRGHFAYQPFAGMVMNYRTRLTPGKVLLTDQYEFMRGGRSPTRKDQTLHIQKARSQGTLNDLAFYSNTELQVNDSNHLNFDVLALGIGHKPLGEVRFNAALQARLKQLRFIPYLLRLPATLAGQGRANFNFRGTLAKPSLSGKASLQKLTGEIIPFGLRFSETSAELTAREPLAVKARLSSKLGNNNLNARGEAHYQLDKGLTGHASVSGKSVTLANLPQLHVVASPDLELNMDRSAAELTGTIAVDEARIVAEGLKGLGSSNNFSSDIIYVDRHGRARNPASSLPLYSQLKIKLGKHTRLYGFGIKTYLDGGLTVHSQPNQPAMAKGEIVLRNGIYRNYGKEFTVQEGSALNFNYSPLDNPNLDITALYNIPTDVSLANSSITRMGIKITGTAHNPDLRLFSNPSMSQSDILSYIVLGRSVSQAQSSEDSGALSSAALAFALNGGSNSVLSDIRQKLGITNLSFGTMSSVPMMSDNLQAQNQTDDSRTALYVGKKITDNFYVSYGISIFTGQQEIDTVYQINDNWSIRTDYTTLDTGADLIYQVTP